MHGCYLLFCHSARLPRPFVGRHGGMSVHGIAEIYSRAHFGYNLICRQLSERKLVRSVLANTAVHKLRSCVLQLIAGVPVKLCGLSFFGKLGLCRCNCGFKLLYALGSIRRGVHSFKIGNGISEILPVRFGASLPRLNSVCVQREYTRRGHNHKRRGNQQGNQAFDFHFVLPKYNNFRFCICIITSSQTFSNR